MAHVFVPPSPLAHVFGPLSIGLRPWFTLTSVTQDGLLSLSLHIDFSHSFQALVLQGINGRCRYPYFYITGCVSHTCFFIQEALIQDAFCLHEARIHDTFYLHEARIHDAFHLLHVGIPTQDIFDNQRFESPVEDVEDISICCALGFLLRIPQQPTL